MVSIERTTSTAHCLWAANGTVWLMRTWWVFRLLWPQGQWSHGKGCDGKGSLLEGSGNSSGSGVGGLFGV
jgi:hypothetical protein